MLMAIPTGLVRLLLSRQAHQDEHGSALRPFHSALDCELLIDGILEQAWLLHTWISQSLEPFFFSTVVSQMLKSKTREFESIRNRKYVRLQVFKVLKLLIQKSGIIIVLPTHFLFSIPIIRPL